MLAADSVPQTAFQGMTTANCCVTVDFAALNPGVPAGPSKWMTTRYALVFVQMRAGSVARKRKRNFGFDVYVGPA